MKGILGTAVLILLSGAAHARWVTEIKSNRDYERPLGTPCGGQVLDRSKDGKIEYRGVQVAPGVVVPWRCKKTADLAPTPTPTPTRTPTPTPAPAPSPVPLVFSTSFERATDWYQVDPRGTSSEFWYPGIPNVGRYGNWTCGGRGDEIVDAANRAGSPGKGFRHWRCAGTNANGGGISISPGSLTEFWMRYHMRYQQGFSWLHGRPHYTKDWYVNVGGQNTFIIGFQGGGYGVHYAPRSQNYSSPATWQNLMGGARGGRWHCVELHMKNGASGVIEMWIDGAQVVSASGNFGTAPWSYFVLGENQNEVVGGPYYTDFDDVAFSTTDRIGC